jgi:Ca2+-dependent lipid-binding protein
MGVLTVKVIKATNLADKDFVGKTDPYVQIELEQDNMVSVFLFFFFCLLTFYRR